MTRVWWIVGFCGLATLSALSVLAAPKVDERTALFRWFDTLSLRDVPSCPLVRYRWLEGDSEGQPKWGAYEVGFLTQHDDKSFTVVDLNCYPFAYGPANPGSKVVYEPIDFDKWAVARLKQVVQSQKWDEVDASRFQFQKARRMELFLLAKACQARGEDELSRRFFALSKTADDFPSAHPTSGGNYDAAIKEEFENVVGSSCQALLAFPANSREKVLEALREYSRAFTKGRYASWVQGTTPLLERMIQEDRDHRTPGMASLSAKDKIAELIFQLRDQNGAQYMSPGDADVFNDPRGNASPASQLAEMGYAAVPQLIDALTDMRPTRTLRDGLRFGSDYTVMSVGEAAEQVLSRIGHHYFGQGSSDPQETRAHWRAGIQAEARKWWQAAETKGERRMLVEDVRTGNGDVYRTVYILAEKYPNDAVPAIAEGIRRATEPSTREILIGALGKVKSSEAQQLALETMRKDPKASVRIAAATALASTHPNLAVDQLIKEWRRQKAPDDFFNDLVEVLASSGRARAVEALGEHLASRSLSLRGNVVDGLGASGFGEWAPVSKQEEKAHDQAAERLLVKELDDTEVTSMTTSVGELSLDDPRVCDLASRSLASFYPKKYVFDALWSPKNPDRVRFYNLNVWGREHGLPLRSPPKPPSAPRADNRRIDPLIAQVVGGSSSARVRLRAVGLPALSRVLERVGESARLAELAQVLSCDVRSVTVSGPTPRAAAGWVHDLKKLEGKFLDSETYTKTLRRCLQRWPKALSGVRFEIHRDTPSSGLALVVFFNPENDSGASGGTWSFRTSLVVDGESWVGESGTCDDLGDLGRYRIHKALLEGPRHVVSISQSFFKAAVTSR